MILEVIIILTLITLYFVFIYPRFDLQYFVTIIACILLSRTLFTIAKKYKNIAWSFKKGYVGEKQVLEDLVWLSNEYDIFPNLKISGEISDIDFVVIGPTGILAIDVKSHKGNIEFDGKDLLKDRKVFEKNIMKQVKSEAYMLSEYLKQKLNRKFYIKPVLVFSNSNARMRFGLSEVDGVYIINKFYLENLFNSFEIFEWGLYKSQVICLLQELVSQ